VERELAARVHANFGLHVDLGLVGGGRDRPDAQTGARECAQMVVFGSFCCSGECCSTFGVIRIGLERVGAEVVTVTIFKIKGYRL
jgi:hypothetical protein